MNKKRTGLFALLGVAAAGALAYYKYKTMSPEEKENLKNKVNDTGKKIKEKVGEVESTISNKYDQIKTKAKDEYNNLAS